MKNPIVSVTQEPVDLGDNICVGKIGSSWLNLYKQLKAGAERATTKYVAMAEDDCLYTQEHYDWIPPRDDTFYYNENVWFVQWGGNHPELNGMYSEWWEKGPRKALSQLICSRDILLKDIDLKLKFLTEDIPVDTIGEPGFSKLRQARVRARSGSASLGLALEEYADLLDAAKAETFRTTTPNLDIRHGTNFTGPKRGTSRRYTLEPWGDFKKVMA
jgi:hypothetical protein